MNFSVLHQIDNPDCVGFAIVNSFNGEESEEKYETLEAALTALPEVAISAWGHQTQGSLRDWAIVVPADAVWARESLTCSGFPDMVWKSGDRCYRSPEHPWNFNKLINQ